MTDRKPPKLVSGERETLLALLQYQRESFVRKLDGVDDEAARKEFVASGTSLLWLTKHVAFAEQIWFVWRFAGRHEREPDNSVRAGDTLEAAKRAYVETWAVVDAIVTQADLDDVCHDTGDDSPVNLRWIVMHMLEEIARHAGHADILRELIDGTTGR